MIWSSLFPDPKPQDTPVPCRSTPCYVLDQTSAQHRHVMAMTRRTRGQKPSELRIGCRHLLNHADIVVVFDFLRISCLSCRCSHSFFFFRNVRDRALYYQELFPLHESELLQRITAFSLGSQSSLAFTCICRSITILCVLLNVSHVCIGLHKIQMNLSTSWHSSRKMVYGLPMFSIVFLLQI